MKSIPLLLFAGLLAVALTAEAQPKKPIKASPSKTISKAMPKEVRALLPAKATTLYLGQLPMGIGGKPTLVHLWATGRKIEGMNHEFAPSPFCIDLFQRGADKAWTLVTSMVYLGEDAPFEDERGVALRWLYPAKKQSPVLVIVSPSYIATRYTVITYPQGVEFGESNSSHVQEFYQGGVGGGKIVYDFGVDKRGTMTVLEDSWYANGPKTRKVFAWNGRGYAVSPAR